MSISAKPITVPINGQRYEIGPDFLESGFTPLSLNVHEVNSEIRTKPGLSYFNLNDEELELFLKYDVNGDSEVKLREGATTNLKLAQSFTGAATRTIDRVKILLVNHGTIAVGKKLTLKIQTDSSGPSTVIGTSADVLCSTVDTSEEWIEFLFATSISITASTKFWMVLEGDYDVSESNYIGWRIDASASPYTEGEAYKYGVAWEATGADQDFLFKTYRDTTKIMLDDSFKLTSGTKIFIVATVDRLFYWNATTTSWVDLSGYLSTNMFTGLVTDKFSADIYPPLDTILITNYINPIKKYTGTGFCTNLGGTPPRAKYLKVYKDHVLAGYIYDAAADRPYRLGWCDAGDIENWTTGTAGYKDFLEGPDFINGLFILNDYVVVTKEKSVHVGYPVTSSYVFQFDQKWFGIGPLDGSYVVENGPEIYMVCNEDIYLFNGGDPISIAEGLIKKEFFSTTDPEYILDGFSMNFRTEGEWHIFVTPTGSEAPTRVWVYNYNKKTWWKYSLTVPVVCGGFYEQESGLTIDELQGTIDQQLWRINDREIQGFNASILLATSTNRIVEVNNLVGEEFGVGVEAYVDSKDYFFNDDTGKRIRGKIDGIVLKASGTICYLYYSTDGGISYTLVDSISLLNSYKVKSLNFRKNVERIRFRIYKNGIGENFQIQAMEFLVQKGGKL